jgi:hypothetical protein
VQTPVLPKKKEKKKDTKLGSVQKVMEQYLCSHEKMNGN